MIGVGGKEDHLGVVWKKILIKLNDWVKRIQELSFAVQKKGCRLV